MSTLSLAARPVFGEGSEHSLFHLMLRAKGVDPMVPGLPLVGQHEARMLLAQANDVEARTSNLELSLSHQGSDVNLSASSLFNDAFQTQYQAARVIEPLFTRQGDIPAGSGESLRFPIATTPVSVGEGLDSATITNTASPVLARVTVPVGTISGQVQVSRSFLDLVCRPGGEALVGRMLGDVYSVEVDKQLYNGTAANGQTQGVNSTSGATAAAYTDASPDTPTMWIVWDKLLSVATTARRAALDVVVMHPRRAIWIESQAASYQECTHMQRLGLTPVRYSNVSIVQGASNTEDSVTFFRKADMMYWSTPPVLTVADDVAGVTSGVVTIAIHGYLASPGGLANPAGVATSGGTGYILDTGF